MSNKFAPVGLVLAGLLLSACNYQASPAVALDSLKPGMPFDQVQSRLAKAGWSPIPPGITCGNGYDASCSVSFSSKGTSICLLFKPTATQPAFDKYLPDEC
ncbi:MAG TPA: hypothetical protein VJ323_21940 [Bryobacteraceae bacterium]|nr:hypothetical protein [Bryobacteraceae bacterium]